MVAGEVFYIVVYNAVKFASTLELQPPIRKEPVRPTLRDVALRASVSIKTVSNVVNGYPHVSGATRERVERAIVELGYQPNLTARSLRSGRSGVVALAVPFLDVPYFAELAGHVVDAAAERGWTVLVDQTNGERERERLVTSGAWSQLIDGLILSPLALTVRDLATRNDSRPLVLLGERIHDGPADHVVVDNVAAAREATLHLVSIGRKRIAAVGVQHADRGVTGVLRLQGWREGLLEAGLTPRKELMAPVEGWRRIDGAQAMATLLAGDEPPDAVFCFNDLLALGALRTLHERGIRVPEDVAVAGFDDIDDGRFSVPTLTTISPDKREIARQAIDLLARRLATTEAGSPQEIFAGQRLVIRESTAGRDAISRVLTDAASRSGEEAVAPSAVH